MIRFWLGFILVIWFSYIIPQEDKLEGMILFLILIWMMIDGVDDFFEEKKSEGEF